MCPALYDSGFVVRQPAWHGLADVLDESPATAEEALEAAGLPWEVKKAPVFAEIPGVAMPVECERRFATYRDDTKAVLGIVGEDWTPVQNRAAFSFLDELVGGGELVYESVGALEGGAKVFVLCRWPEHMELGAGERIARYLLAVNGHAGTLAFRIKNVHERVVCSNTLGVALSESGRSEFVGRHTSGIEFRAREARDAMGMAFRQDERFKAMADELLAWKMSPPEEVAFTERLIPLTVAQADAGGTAARNAEAARTAVLSLMRNGEDLENVRGTAWAALQAATEYADWSTRVVGDGRVAAERRFKRNLLRDDPIKLRALHVLAPAYAPRGAGRVAVEV